MQGSDYWREDVLGLSEFCYAYQNNNKIKYYMFGLIMESQLIEL